jgi:hypothetical protein
VEPTEVALKSNVEAAAELGIASGTLDNWRVKGCGPAFVKLGGSIKYRDEDLQAFVASCVRRSTSDKPEAA